MNGFNTAEKITAQNSQTNQSDYNKSNILSGLYRAKNLADAVCALARAEGGDNIDSIDIRLLTYTCWCGDMFKVGTTTVRSTDKGIYFIYRNDTVEGRVFSSNPENISLEEVAEIIISHIKSVDNGFGGTAKWKFFFLGDDSDESDFWSDGKEKMN